MNIACIFKGHKIESGRFKGKRKGWFHSFHCSRCGKLLGVPKYAGTKNNKNAPVPPLPRNITDYKFYNSAKL